MLLLSTAAESIPDFFATIEGGMLDGLGAKVHQNPRGCLEAVGQNATFGGKRKVLVLMSSIKCRARTVKAFSCIFGVMPIYCRLLAWKVSFWDKATFHA
jgi:hypothetical protein